MTEDLLMLLTSLIGRVKESGTSKGAGAGGWAGPGQEDIKVTGGDGAFT